MASEEFNITETTDDAFEPDTAVARPKKARRVGLPISVGNLIFGAVVVASVAAIYVLRLGIAPEKATAEQRQDELRVDTAISLLDGSAATDAAEKKTAEVVDSFYYQAKQRQVPPQLLTGNPFVYKHPKARKAPGDKNKGGDKTGPMAQREADEEEELAQALAALRELNLQSVLMGPSGAVAMISNNLLAKGQEIQGWSVADIKPRQVTLVWRNEKKTLKMPE